MPHPSVKQAEHLTEVSAAPCVDFDSLPCTLLKPRPHHSGAFVKTINFLASGPFHVLPPFTDSWAEGDCGIGRAHHRGRLAASSGCAKLIPKNAMSPPGPRRRAGLTQARAIRAKLSPTELPALETAIATPQQS
ncbi:hypothetical protein HaLaN_22202, partial [Haematococcus lacustris]